jgi:hypothetical protein
VGCFFVPRRVIRGAVNLDEHESGRVILLPGNIESCDARLAEAVAGVLDSGGLEGLDIIGLYVYENVNNKHSVLLVESQIRGQVYHAGDGQTSDIFSAAILRAPHN